MKPMDEKKPCEGRSDDTELLKGIYQDAKMGEETLKTLLKAIERADQK